MFLLTATAVDGGHRAIKYSRVGGVKKEIYSEGKHTQYSAFGSSNRLSF